MREAAVFLCGVSATITSLWCARRCSNKSRLSQTTTDIILETTTSPTYLIEHEELKDSFESRDLPACVNSGDESSVASPNQLLDSPDIRPSFNPIVRMCSSEVRLTPSLEKGEDSDGNKTINQYTIISDIGRGSFSKVKLAFDNNSDSPRAVKIMRKSQVRRDSGMIRELAVMKKTNHKNIVNLFEVIDEPGTGKVYFILEFIAGGPVAHIKLNGHLKEEVFSYQRVHSILVDVASGLEYLHLQRIIHRDIKPENLLVARNGTVKITDFGVSAVQSQDGTSHLSGHGTPAFNPPESNWAKSERASVPVSSVDVWGMGITLYALKFGKIPFNFKDKSLVLLSDSIRERSIEFPTDSNPAFVDILTAMLCKNPYQRVSISDLGRFSFVRKGALDHSSNQPITVSSSECDSAVTSLSVGQRVFMVAKVKSRMKQKRLSARRSLLQRQHSSESPEQYRGRSLPTPLAVPQL